MANYFMETSMDRGPGRLRVHESQRVRHSEARAYAHTHAHYTRPLPYNKLQWKRMFKKIYIYVSLDVH